MKQGSFRSGFICDHCRKYCGDCDKDNYQDYPRKIRISCLGSYCDEPCELLQTIPDLTVKMLIDKIKYLQKELNKQFKGNNKNERPKRVNSPVYRTVTDV